MLRAFACLRPPQADRQVKKGFASIVEMIVTAVIFAIAAIGIFSTISMLRAQSPVSDSGGRLGAAYTGKRILEDLRGRVDAGEWMANLGPLATGTLHTNTIGGYTVNWYLVDVPGDFPPGMAPRRLVMNVYYPD